MLLLLINIFKYIFHSCDEEETRMKVFSKLLVKNENRNAIFSPLLTMSMKIYFRIISPKHNTVNIEQVCCMING